MGTIHKRVLDRFNKSVSKYQKILNNAHSRDLNEADTVTIITDILSDVLNFDKYSEVTSEYAIRNTYCNYFLGNKKP